MVASGAAVDRVQVPFWGGLCLGPDPEDCAFGDRVAEAAWRQGLLGFRHLPGAYSRLRRQARAQGRAWPRELLDLEWSLRSREALLFPPVAERVRSAGGRIGIAMGEVGQMERAAALLASLGFPEGCGLLVEGAVQVPAASMPWRGLEEAIGGREPLPELLPLRCFASDRADDAAGRFGAAVLGPVLALFCDWVVSQCVSAGIRKVFPLLREGRILAPFIQRAATVRGFELAVSPLAVSRRSTLALRAGGDLRAWMAMAREARGMSLGDLFRMLDAGPEDSVLMQHQDLLLRDLGGESMGGACLGERLNAWMDEPKVVRKAQERMVSEVQALEGYLGQALPGGERLALVDSGCRATINAALEPLLRRTAPAPMHLLLVGSDATCDKQLDGLDIRGYLAGSGGCADLARIYARSPDLVEQLLMADEGSVVGYSLRGDCWKPVCGEPHGAETDRRVKQACQDGAKGFQELWLAARGSNPAAAESLAERREEAGVLLARALLVPLEEEARILGDLRVDENAGASQVAHLCDEAADRLLERLGPDSFLKVCRHAFESCRVRWPQGTLTRKDPTRLARQLVQAHQAFPAPTGQAWFETVYREVAQDLMPGPVCIYGAGPVGRAFWEEARRAGLVVSCFSDTNPSQLGAPVAGVPARPLDAALAQGARVFVAASFEHGPAMAQGIQHAAARAGVVPRVRLFTEEPGEGAGWARQGYDPDNVQH